MFDDIGGKIKGLAKLICWIGIIASVIGAIAMFVNASNSRYYNGSSVAYGIALLIGGPLLSWLSSLGLYGFGELIDNSREIADSLNHTNARGNVVFAQDLQKLRR